MTTATLTFRRYFNGERKGDFRRRTTLTISAIQRVLDAERSSGGWGCVVEMTPEQLAAVGGWLIHDGSCGALAHGDQSVVIVRPAHRPRLDPTAARINLVVRVHPDTRKRLAAEAKRTGESQGQLIDRLAATLSPQV